ncbi:MAG: hypothetical protein Q9191_003688 [Dirinaria sp. TL-2023a]
MESNTVMSDISPVGNTTTDALPLETAQILKTVMATETSKNRAMMLMDKARAEASFDSRQLMHFLYGGEEASNRRQAAFKRVEDALGLSDTKKLPRQYSNLNREGQYLDGLQFGRAMMEDEIKHRHGVFDYHTHQFALIISSPFGHNPLMFGPTLKLQTTPEQRAYWMPLVESGRIVGTYCQTELGHGTFLRGLETTATFDSETDEFVIHSPTVTSTKYWPSALGFSASHAVVMAKLITGGKNYGVHPFMVQLRSLEDYKTLPGIETGDIGLRMGFNSTDMGYATFNQVRIPRMHMLMGNAQVQRDGTYVKAAHEKLSYSTMIYTRDRIIHTVAFQLAQAVVIASRYSIVREQGVGFATDTVQEIPIIAYKSQQYRILSLMSQAYALAFAAKTCTSIYQDVVHRQTKGDHSTLPYGHAITAALKAYATQVAFDGAEDARKCCGGYGFSVLSGFPAIVGTLAPMPTLEGENYVMYQQTARYLLKAATAIKEGRPSAVDKGARYLSDPTQTRCPFSGKEDFLNPANQVQIYRHRAARLTFHAYSLVEKAQKEDLLPYAEAWNKHMLPLVYAARAHIELFVLESFTAQISLCTDTSGSNPVLENLRSLFALTAIENPASPGAMGFVEDGYIAHPQLQTIRAVVHHDLLAKLTPEIIALGDAWGFSDASLGSALGRRDGDVYTTLMEWTRQLPLNVQARAEGGMHRRGYEGVIGPMLRSRL